MNETIPDTIARLAANPAFAARMDDFYRRADAAIAEHRPVCINRGACCRFREFGHRLYVTTVELAYFAHRQRAVGWRPVESDAACPYQQAGQCTAREHRPLGCRIFFCDPAARDWQGPEFERHLSELKQIGDEFGVPYRFGEWTQALRDGQPASP